MDGIAKTCRITRTEVDKGAQESQGASVPSRVRNLRKMQNFWANFSDFNQKLIL